MHVLHKAGIAVIFTMANRERWLYYTTVSHIPPHLTSSAWTLMLYIGFLYIIIDKNVVRFLQLVTMYIYRSAFSDMCDISP